jgi:hypothetical protein
MKTKYRVKAGIHIEDGVTYKKGDIVVSDRDLAKTFAQKFDVVGQSQEAEPAAVSEPVVENKPTREKFNPTRTMPKSRGKVRDDFEDD